MFELESQEPTLVQILSLSLPRLVTLAGYSTPRLPGDLSNGNGIFVNTSLFLVPRRK